jgi:hypothetical protein
MPSEIHHGSSTVLDKSSEFSVNASPSSGSGLLSKDLSLRSRPASPMIAAGVNAKALSTFMCHANISITLDRYGHLMPGSEAEAAELLDAYLAAQRKRSEHNQHRRAARRTGARGGVTEEGARRLTRRVYVS